jgi:hypothetical protein
VSVSNLLNKGESYKNSKETKPGTCVTILFAFQQVWNTTEDNAIVMFCKSSKSLYILKSLINAIAFYNIPFLLLGVSSTKAKGIPLTSKNDIRGEIHRHHFFVS